MRIKILLIVLLLSACAPEEQEKEILLKRIDKEVSAKEAYASLGKLKLSEYHFFEGQMKDFDPSENVFPYAIKSPLFSDHAIKDRFIFLPNGAKIDYRQEDVFEFPVGSILIKNFSYSAEQLGQKNDKIIETRLLLHEEDGWKALAYIWNEEQNEAFLEITGGELSIDLVGEGHFDYAVPTMNQCKSCHDLNGKISPIGPKARQMNHNEQVAYLISNELMEGAPEAENWPSMADWQDIHTDTDKRSRAYLDANCAHCHRIEGPAKNSGLYLTYDEVDPYKLGIRKKPVAAGKGSGGFIYDILPGKADESILLHRMKINDPGTKMPELGRELIHEEGIA